MSAEIETLHKPFAAFLRSKELKFINPRPDRESTIGIGWPDFTILHPQRPAILIEFKDKGKLSPAQKECHQSLAAAGYRVHVIRSLQIAIETVYHWLSDVRTEAPIATVGALLIKQIGDKGDYVVSGAGTPIRRATLSDLKMYQRTP